MKLNNDYNSQESYFKPYCVGIVAINKKLHTHIAEIMPIESAAMLDGELNDKWDEIVVKGLDADIKDYNNQAKFTKTIRATWAALHQANRFTSPDVRRGDKVLVYRLGDSNVFYWDTMDDYKKLRRLETVVYGYSATKIEDEELTPDNTYVQGVSTHEHMVTLIHTSKHFSNKEKFKYAIFVDTKPDQCHIVIKDDVGNRIVLQSLTNSIRLETKGNQGFIQIDNNRITSKGNWYHRGPITVEDDIMTKQTVHALKEVIARDIGLTTHIHPPSPLPADSQRAIATWKPHKDELIVNYRNPELLK